MTGPDVLRAVRTVMRPVLKDFGFVFRTDRTAWRHRPRLIDVVNIQLTGGEYEDPRGGRMLRFALNLGLFPTDMRLDHPEPVRKGVLCPREFACPIRWSVSPAGVGLAESTWDVRARGETAEETVQAATLALLDRGLPWFDAIPDGDALLTRLIAPGTEDEAWGAPKRGCPAWHCLVGYVALGSERYDVAEMHLRSALSFYEGVTAAWFRKDGHHGQPSLRAALALASALKEGES